MKYHSAAIQRRNQTGDKINAWDWVVLGPGVMGKDPDDKQGTILQVMAECENGHFAQFLAAAANKYDTPISPKESNHDTRD